MKKVDKSRDSGAGKRRRLLVRSRLFRRSFLTYLIMLFAFLAGYLFLMIVDYNASQKKDLEARFSSEVRLAASLMDNKLTRARYIVSSIGGSTALSSLYVQTYQKDSAADAYTYSQAKNQIMSIQSSANDLSVVNILLMFNGTQRIYTSSSVISLEYPAEDSVRGRGLTRKSVNDLLGIDNRNILLQNEYLIFYDDYCYTYKGVSRGRIMVLLNPAWIENEISAELTKGCGFGLLSADGKLLSLEAAGTKVRTFEADSSVMPELSYQLYVPEAALSIDLSTMLVRALLFGLAFGAVAIVLSWYFSMRHYRPFESIARMASPDNANVVVNDADTVIGAMQKLMTEKDATSRKMMEIRPYARKGAIQEVLRGSLSLDNLRVLYAENTGELKFLYYAVAAVSLVVLPAKENMAPSEVLLEKALKAVEGLTDQKCVWYGSAGDHHHLYCIAAFDDIPEWEELFYGMQAAVQREVDLPECRVTVGVSLLKEDVAQLSDARIEAQTALSYMITGGRGQVYFYDPGIADNDRDYWFPKDAVRTLAKLMSAKDEKGVDAFFAELLKRNTTDHELSSRSMELLVDELHLTTVHVMQELLIEEDLAIDVRKVEGEATIDEIFSYYRSVCGTVLSQLPERQESVSDEELRREIAEYIESHYLDPDLSLSALTERFRVTNRFISTLCNTAFGKNYLQYVQEKRIYYAKELLDRGGMSIEEIAAASGYVSVLTFRRNFKSILGMNPSDYKG